MKEYQSLSHTRWDCKYHVVFIPKRRKKRVFGVLRRHLGEVLHELASHKESKIVEGHLMGGPCAYMYQHSAQVRSVECCGISEGEERDPNCSEVWRATEEFHRRALLGQRLLCFDGRVGREHGTGVYPKSGRRRRSVRSNEAHNGVGRPRAAHGVMGAFEALTISSHRLCRWYLTFLGASRVNVRDITK